MVVKKKARPAARSPAAPATPPPAPDARIARLRELVAVLESSTLAELSYEDQDVAVTLVRSPRSPAAVTAPVINIGESTPAAPTPIGPPPADAAPDANVVIVKSPFVGTFYRAPKPGLPNYTDVGERVHRGKILCIVEAMKLMNEIESDVDGTLLEVLAENGHAVQYNDPLFRIRKG